MKSDKYDPSTKESNVKRCICLVQGDTHASNGQWLCLADFRYAVRMLRRLDEVSLGCDMKPVEIVLSEMRYNFISPML